jgi:hypothetical protein
VVGSCRWSVPIGWSASDVNVPRDWWPDLVRWRSFLAAQQIPDDCRALLFYVEDAEKTGDWLGYGSKEAYCREGLGIEVELVDWAREGLRISEKTRSATAT